MAVRKQVGFQNAGPADDGLAAAIHERARYRNARVQPGDEVRAAHVQRFAGVVAFPFVVDQTGDMLGLLDVVENTDAVGNWD